MAALSEFEYNVCRAASKASVWGDADIVAMMDVGADEEKIQAIVLFLNPIICIVRNNSGQLPPSYIRFAMQRSGDLRFDQKEGATKTFGCKTNRFITIAQTRRPAI